MENLDQSLFVFINSTLSHPLLDATLVPLTDLHKNPTFVAVFLPLALGLWFYLKRWKALPVLIGLILSIAAADLLSYRVFKPLFERPRPPAVESTLVLRTERYAGYSFPSNHAANNFAGATFLSACYPALWAPFFAIASLVALSRVYVGVHYPGDILAGALLGTIIGLFFFRIWVIILLKLGRRWPSFNVNVKPTDTGGALDDDHGKL